MTDASLALSILFLASPSCSERDDQPKRRLDWRVRASPALNRDQSRSLDAGTIFVTSLVVGATLLALVHTAY